MFQFKAVCCAHDGNDRRIWLHSIIAACTLLCCGPIDISVAVPINPLTSSLAETYDPASAHPMPYRLFLPPDLPTTTEKFPLVLFLHGSGERGNDNKAQVVNHLAGLIHAVRNPLYEAFLLAPQLTDDPNAGGWNPNSPYDRTMGILNQVIQDYPVDINRIYITGLSMGGYGTFTYIAKFPSLFAAAVPMSGGGSTSWAPLIKDIPLWDFHGALDDTVSVDNSRRMIAAITAAGGSPLYTEIPSGGHNIWDVTYGDDVFEQYGLYEWMFSQTLAVPEPSTLSLAISASCGLGLFLVKFQRGRVARGNRSPLATRERKRPPILRG